MEVSTKAQDPRPRAQRPCPIPSFPTSRHLSLKPATATPACRDQLFALCRSYLDIVARAQVETWLRAKVDASDLVQETMLEAFRDFERFGGNSEQEWLAWLKRILAHNVADFVRRYRGTAKRQARREVPIRSPQDSTHAFGAAEPAAPGPTPSQEFLQIDNELRVTAALAQLPADYQEVIVLRNLQRLSFNEVAERMERSRPAVQMLWMRAIKKLQEALGTRKRIEQGNHEIHETHERGKTCSTNYRHFSLPALSFFVFCLSWFSLELLPNDLPTIPNFSNCSTTTCRNFRRASGRTARPCSANTRSWRRR